MSWEREPLWSKARLFFEKAFSEERENPAFGLWCTMGLELLARSAISKISPTLLAEPDREHKYLLHALNLGSVKTPKRSIATNQVLILCKTLIADFTQENYTLGLALSSRRNDELHSGSAAFAEYSTQHWLGGLYRCCRVLAESQGESLSTLFGKEEAEVADKILSEMEREVLKRIKSLIAKHNKVFLTKGQKVREKLAIKAENEGTLLAYQEHHRIDCPACSCVATVRGNAYGTEQIEHNDGEIIVRQAVVPATFSCNACGLKLNGYGELSVAGVADHFTQRTTFTPEEYYNLIDPDDESVIQSILEEYTGFSIYSNE